MDEKISVIMPVKNVLDMAVVCIDSLQKYTPDCDLILIDDGSEQETSEYLKTVFCHKLIRNEQSLGWCKAINQGFEYAETKFIVLANSDIVFTPKWSEKMISLYEGQSTLGLLGPTTDSVSNKQNRRFSGKIGVGCQLEYTDTLIFFCVMMLRKVYEDIGGLDERFGLGGQDDADYCVRASEAGWDSAIARGVFLYHYGSATFREEFKHDTKKSWEYAESRQKILMDKHWARSFPSDNTLNFIKSAAKTTYQSDKNLPSVMIGIPNRGNNATQLTMNLIYWKTCGRYRLRIEAPSGLFPLDNARNTIVKKFLELDYDYLWWIDDDITPPLDALDRLLAADKDIIGAVCFSYREENGALFPYPVTLRYNEDKKYILYYGKGIDWVDATGGACVLFKRRVYERIERPYEFVYHKDGTLSLTCDFKVFQKCQAAGFKVWIDFNLLCGHQKLCDIKGFQDLLLRIKNKNH